MNCGGAIRNKRGPRDARSVVVVSLTVLVATCAAGCDLSESPAAGNGPSEGAASPSAAPRVFAEVRIDRQILRDAGHWAGQSREEFQEYCRLQTKLIKSPAVLEGALKRPAVANLEAVIDRREQASEWLEDRIRVDSLEPEFIRVSFVGDMTGAAALVNAVVAQYIEDAAEAENRTARQQIAELEKARETNALSLKEHRARLDNAVRSIGARPQETNGRWMAEHETLMQLDRDRIQLILDRKTQELRLEELTARSQAGPGGEQGAEIAETNAAINRIKARLELIQDESARKYVHLVNLAVEARMGVSYADDDDQLCAAARTISDQLAQSKSKLRPCAVSLYRSARL